MDLRGKSPGIRRGVWRRTAVWSSVEASICDHFEQSELSKENPWRSYATKKIYLAYLTQEALKRARNVHSSCLDGFNEIRLSDLEKNGGDDETRTRDLCRDRA